MEVHLTPDIETKLASLARRQGIDAHALARTAIESYVDYDARFVGEVEKGLVQVHGGETLTHEAVGARLNQYLAEKQARSPLQR